MTAPHLAALLVLSGLLGACAPQPQTSEPVSAGEAPPPPAPQVEPGRYRWDGDGFCATLIIGNANSFTTDLDCDGSVDSRANAVSLRDDMLTVDRAVMTIKEIDDTGFSGTWTLRNNSRPARFNRASG